MQTYWTLPSLIDTYWIILGINRKRFAPYLLKLCLIQSEKVKRQKIRALAFERLQELMDYEQKILFLLFQICMVKFNIEN